MHAYDAKATTLFMRRNGCQVKPYAIVGDRQAQFFGFDAHLHINMTCLAMFRGITQCFLRHTIAGQFHSWRDCMPELGIFLNAADAKRGAIAASIAAIAIPLSPSTRKSR